MGFDPIEDGIRSIGDTAQALSERGWADEFYGNISLNLGALDINRYPILQRYQYDMPLDQLEGNIILLTRSTSSMDQIASKAIEHVGAYVVIHGSLNLLLGRGPPTSEVLSHLRIHGSKCGLAVVHCHFDRMETIEREYVINGGFGWVERSDPGSKELALATEESSRSYNIIVWEGHGIISFGSGLDEVFEQISRAHEKLFLRNEPVFVPGK